MPLDTIVLWISVIPISEIRDAVLGIFKDSIYRFGNKFLKKSENLFISMNIAYIKYNLKGNYRDKNSSIESSQYSWLNESHLSLEKILFYLNSSEICFYTEIIDEYSLQYKENETIPMHTYVSKHINTKINNYTSSQFIFKDYLLLNLVSEVICSYKDTNYLDIEYLINHIFTTYLNYADYFSIAKKTSNYYLQMNSSLFILYTLYKELHFDLVALLHVLSYAYQFYDP